MIKYIFIFLLFFQFLITGCGDYDPDINSDDEGGAVTFSLKWPGAPKSATNNPLQPSASSLNPYKNPLHISSVTCDTIGVSTIEAIVYDESNSQLTTGGPWACSEHSGRITGIKPGENRKFVVTGKDLNDNILYKGEKAGISIELDNTADVGVITMNYNDTPPKNITFAAFINNGAEVTSSGSVTLSLSAADDKGISAYFVSESSATPAIDDTGWIAVPSATNYSADVSFTLSNGYGLKSIYVWFRDEAGNISEPVTGSITLTLTGSDIDMVLIAGGCFDMGDTFGDGYPDGKPVHKVCVDDFYLGVHEVTQGEWKNVMGSNPSSFQNCGDDCPVESVSWNDAQNFIAALNIQTGLTYRLPTESEWEFAARGGGQDLKYAGTSSDEELGNYAWYSNNSGSMTHQVKGKSPNSLGLYDMSGNVWEWVQDWYSGSYYSNSPENNPVGPDSGSYRVIRGGSWNFIPWGLRAANRRYITPDVRSDYIGFRLARTF